MADWPIPTNISCGIRMSLDSTDPLLSIASDITAATVVYAIGFRGNQCPIIVDTGTNASQIFSISASGNLSIKLTDTQTGTTANANAVITGLTSTLQFVRGMKVSGTNIAANSTISSIDSDTQITLNNNCTGSGAVSLTFKCPASTNYDIYATVVSGAAVLRFSSAWTTATARADSGVGLRNGIMVNAAGIGGSDANAIAAFMGTLLCTVRTTTTDGQTEDSKLHRYLSNYYQRASAKLTVIDTTSSWNYTTATWRQARATAGNRVEAVCCDASIMASLRVFSVVSNSNANVALAVGVGLDSTTVNSADIQGGYSPTAGTSNTTAHGFYEGAPGIGYHALNWLEISAATGTTTWIGQSAGLSAVQSGMSGRIDC